MWEPAVVAVQTAPVQEPSGLIVNVVELVTFPREFPLESVALAEYVFELPAAMLALAGVIVSEPAEPEVTVRVAVSVLPL